MTTRLTPVSTSSGGGGGGGTLSQAGLAGDGGGGGGGEQGGVGGVAAVLKASARHGGAEGGEGQRLSGRVHLAQGQGLGDGLLLLLPVARRPGRRGEREKYVTHNHKPN